jgi:hypothetical protein
VRVTALARGLDGKGARHIGIVMDSCRAKGERSQIAVGIIIIIEIFGIFVHVGCGDGNGVSGLRRSM